MKPKQVKKLLYSKIRYVSDHPEAYSLNPGSDFTRNRKIPLERLLTGIIGLGGAVFPMNCWKCFIVLRTRHLLPHLYNKETSLSRMLLKISSGLFQMTYPQGFMKI